MVKRNILLVTGVFPPAFGGMQNYYYHLCGNSGHNVTVLASDHSGAEAFDAQQSFKIIRKPFFTDEKVNLIHTLRLYHYTKAVIEREKIDITVYGYILYGFIGLLLKLFYGKPYVVSVHGMDVRQLARFFGMRGIVSLILKHASSVMANSKYTKSIVQELGVPGERIEVIYPGVEDRYDKALKDPILAEKHGLTNKYVLMTLGRLVKRKGFDMVIKSLGEIKRTVPNAVYLVVGDGPEMQELVRLAQESGVEDSVIFAGRASQQDMVKYYNLCDLFIMPSRLREEKGDLEGFGIVYMEAASCAKPVIGGNSGGVREAVLDGETGLLVDPASTASIAEAVIRIYSDSNLAGTLGANGYLRAKAQFRYQKIVEGFDEMLSGPALIHDRSKIAAKRENQSFLR